MILRLDEGFFWRNVPLRLFRFSENEKAGMEPGLLRIKP